MKLKYFTEGRIPSKWAHSIQVIKMAQAFQQTGYDVELISTCCWADWRNDNLKTIWDQYGVSTPFKLTRIPLSWLVQKEKSRNLGFFSYSYFVSLLAKFSSVDLVFARSYLTPYWTSRLNIPTIAETHAEPDNSYQKRKLYEATKCKSFKALVTISDKLAESYAKVGVPEKKILVEQDGVDLNNFKTIKQEAVTKLRNKLLDNKKGIAMYSGHLYDYKGIPTLLKAAKITPEIQFVLVGGWEKDCTRVLQEASSMKLENVTITGYISNAKVPEYLKTADVLLLPYTDSHEQSATTSPLKLFEYMAAECPIVATNLPNVIKVIKDGHNGVIVKADDERILSSTIKKIINNPTNYKNLALQARRDVEYFSWNKRVERIIAFLHQ